MSAPPAPAFHGVIPPLVTPLSARDRLDLAGLERLLEHVISGGVHGLFILGTTGEAPSLSYRLRREVIDRICRLTRDRVPVMVGITDTAFVESLALAHHAQEAGAAAVVLTTPYYFPAGQTELESYVRNLAAELPLPLVLYNMPQLTKVWFEFETLERLCDLPGIVGLKDSSGDLDYFTKALTLKGRRPDWSMMMGSEVMLPEAIRRGGDGVVAGGANVVPALFVECYQALRDGDAARSERSHARIVEFQQLYEIGKYASRHIKATKCCLSLMGICDDFTAEPFHHFRPRERGRVAEIMGELRIPVTGP